MNFQIPLESVPVSITTIEVLKIAPIGTRTRICHSRVRRSAGFSVFFGVLRSFYSALNSCLIHYE